MFLLIIMMTMIMIEHEVHQNMCGTHMIISLYASVGVGERCS